jgi:PHP family Zn ribbon phosphoesterase
MSKSLHPSIELAYVLDNMHSDYHEGWCIACGFEQQDVPRLAVEACDECGKLTMYGSFALCELLTGLPAPQPD